MVSLRTVIGSAFSIVGLLRGILDGIALALIKALSEKSDPPLLFINEDITSSCLNLLDVSRLGSSLRLVLSFYLDSLSKNVSFASFSSYLGEKVSI